MKKYVDTVLNRYGRPVNGASVTVRVQNTSPGTGALATLYSDNGVTTTANPVTTDVNGQFSFYVADGRYDLTVAGTGITTQTIGDVEIADSTQGVQTISEVFVDGQVYPMTSAGIQAAIDSLPAFGGIVRLPVGDFAISSTINITKQNVHLIGAGKSTGTAGTRLLATSGTVSPMISWTGASLGSRNSFGSIERLGIEGVYTATQKGLYVQYVNNAIIRDVVFNNLGQAEHIDYASWLTHENISYANSGSGNTVTTATVRCTGVDNSNPATQLHWRNCDWEGDYAGTKQGVSLWLEQYTGQVFVTDSLFDYVSTLMTSRLIVCEGTDDLFLIGNTIFANGTSNPSTVIDFTATVGNRATDINIVGNAIGWGGTNAIKCDYVQSVNVTGNTFQGPGTSSSAINLTANSLTCMIGPNRVHSADNLCTNSAGLVNTVVQYTNGGIRVGTNPGASGPIGIPNNVYITGRNAANSADINMIAVNSSDTLNLGATANITGALVTTNGSGVFGSPFVTTNSNPATAGNFMRMATNDVINIRNNANGANLNLLSKDTSDIVQVGDTAGLRLGSSSGPRFLSGTGTPEGSVTAPIGSLYLRTDGGAGTSHYVKESGAGNTGWVAK